MFTCLLQVREGNNRTQNTYPYNVYINSPNKYNYPYWPGYYNYQETTADTSNQQRNTINQGRLSLSNNQTFWSKMGSYLLFWRQNQQPNMYDNNLQQVAAPHYEYVRVSISGNFYINCCC